MILFPDLPDLLIEHVDIADEITLMLRTTSPAALCPNCQTPSTRVQSRYHRTLHDLPSAGRPVHLLVHLRRFFCRKSTCAQKIFTERLPELCRPHAQRTIRLQEALCQLGLRVGGQAGADVGSDTSHQWESRYHLAFGSSLSRASDFGTANHWIGRLGCDTKLHM